jgi:hypothetical protein
MLLRDIIRIYLEKHVKLVHVATLGGRNSGFWILRLVVHILTTEVERVNGLEKDSRLSSLNNMWFQQIGSKRLCRDPTYWSIITLTGRPSRITAGIMSFINGRK